MKGQEIKQLKHMTILVSTFGLNGTSSKILSIFYCLLRSKITYTLSKCFFFPFNTFMLIHYCDIKKGTSRIYNPNYGKIFAIHEKKIKKERKNLFYWSNWNVETWRSLLYFS